MSQHTNHLVISALGKDKSGIIGELSSAILNQECNILDSRMTVLAGEFAILLLVEGPWNQLVKLEDQLPTLQQQLDLTIISSRPDGDAANKKILPYIVEAIALDHPGIVHNLANFFSQRQINIHDMNTSSYSAAHTGTPMFTVRMSIGIPSTIQIASLREELMDFCDSLNLDAIMEPVK